jgi:hypothetical protein
MDLLLLVLLMTFVSSNSIFIFSSSMAGHFRNTSDSASDLARGAHFYVSNIFINSETIFGSNLKEFCTKLI